MIVAIEGMDGSGKSTIAKEIVDVLGFNYVEKPNRDFFGMTKKEYDELCNRVYDLSEQTAKAWFFGFGNLISVLTAKKRDTIIDRHFLSNYFWNGNENNEDFFDLLLNVAGLPDLTIVLYCGLEERLKRLNKRDPKDPDISDKEKHVMGYDKMLSFAKKHNLPFLIINTEKYGQEKVSKICIKFIEKIKTMSKNEVAEYCSNINMRLKSSGKEPFSKIL